MQDGMNSGAPMPTCTGNEADVRAEIVDPFLTALGYRRGTPANIDREFRLTYDRHFLGRKKPTDKPLVGKADYRLSVLGFGHWVLDAKAYGVEIDRDAIEQAISYAAHPEVAGHYAAVLNGKRFVMYRTKQSSHEEPLVDLEVTTGEALAEAMMNLLSPAAIRRDCRPPIVDLGTPIAEGLRSSAKLIGGFVLYRAWEWAANVPLPPSEKARLDEMCRRMSSYRAAITGGRVWRDETSRIRAKLTWSAPEPTLMQFAIEKRLFDTEYVCLDGKMSRDPAKPAHFDAIGQLSVQQGEQLFDILAWRTQMAQLGADMKYQGHVVGVLEGEKFCGGFQAHMQATCPVAPGFMMVMFGWGEFEVDVDPM